MAQFSGAKKRVIRDVLEKGIFRVRPKMMQYNVKDASKRKRYEPYAS